MEIDGCLSESDHDGLVQLKGRLDDGGSLLLQARLELFQVTSEESRIDGEERLVVGERDTDNPEMTLITRVHVERPGARVHRSHVLAIGDVLDGELGNIVPMLVILVLSQEGDRALGIIRVQLRHVQVIDIKDQLHFTGRPVLPSSLLLQLLLKHGLQVSSIRVIIELDVLVGIVLRVLGRDFLQDSLG